MSHPGFTVLPANAKFDDKLARLYLLDGQTVTAVMNKLDMVLQTIPHLAGKSFEHHGKTYHFIRYLGYQVVYQILKEDCIVSLHDIRPLCR